MRAREGTRDVGKDLVSSWVSNWGSKRACVCLCPCTVSVCVCVQVREFFVVAWSELDT